MSLAESLYQTLVRLDGEALVLHPGEVPYVVSGHNQQDVSPQPMTQDGLLTLLSQVLPLDARRQLEQTGSVRHEIDRLRAFPRDQFSVVAAWREGELWVEVRRAPAGSEDLVPSHFFEPEKPAVAEKATPATGARVAPTLHLVSTGATEQLSTRDEDLGLPDASQLWPGTTRGDRMADDFIHSRSMHTARSSDDDADAVPHADVAPPSSPPANQRPKHELDWLFESNEPPVTPSPARAGKAEPSPTRHQAPPDPGSVRHEAAPAEANPSPLPEPAIRGLEALRRAAAEWAAESPKAARVATPPVVPPAPAPAQEAPPTPRVQPAPAAVLAPVERLPQPLPSPSFAVGRTYVAPAPVERKAPAVPVAPAVVPGVAESPAVPGPGAAPPQPGVARSVIERLLLTAAGRGASTLYLSSQARPAIRQNGELQVLEREGPFLAREVETMVASLMPPASRQVPQANSGVEWTIELADLGRVRCLAYRDHRGPGAIFRMMPLSAVSSSHLGLSRDVQSLATETEGLIIVAGPAASGKSTLVASLVDQINRTRGVHVVTVEREIVAVHDQGSAMISQLEVRGSDAEMLTAARLALRENPDVLVVEEVRSTEMASLALEAAAGRLVICSLRARSATEAVARLLDLFPADRRQQVQFDLADSLRGVVAQVLVRRPVGGRVAARELLLNTSAAAAAIADGKLAQLPMVIEAGRRAGMVPMNVPLAGLVQSGQIEPRDAYRAASDRAGLLALFERQGLDVSFADRLA